MNAKLLVKPIDVQDRDYKTIGRIRLEASESGVDLVVESNQPVEQIGPPRQHIGWAELDKIREELSG